MKIDGLNEIGKIWIQKRINQQKQKNIVITQDTVNLIVDWFNYSIDHVHNFEKKFYKITWDEAIRLQEKWHKTFHKKKRHIIDDENTKLIYQCNQDYSIYQIVTQDGLDYESAQMNHCVKTYSLDRYDVYSLRDQKNHSHMTIAYFCDDNKLKDIKLKNNRKITIDYFNLICNWLTQKTKLQDFIPFLEVNNNKITTTLNNEIKEENIDTDFIIDNQSLILNDIISESSYLKNTSYKYNNLICFLEKEDEEITISANKLHLITTNKKIKLTLSDCNDFKINPNIFDIFDVTLINCKEIKMNFNFPVKKMNIKLINSYAKFSVMGNFCLDNLHIERDEVSIIDFRFTGSQINKEHHFNINGEMMFIDCNVDLFYLKDIKTFRQVFKNSKIKCKKQNMSYKTSYLIMENCNVKNLNITLEANKIDFQKMDFDNTLIKPITEFLILNECKNINKTLCCFYKKKKNIEISNYYEKINLSYFDNNKIRLQDSHISVINFTSDTDITFKKCYVNILNDNKTLKVNMIAFDNSKVIFKNVVDIVANIFWILDTNVSLKNLYCKDTLCFCFDGKDNNADYKVSFHNIHCNGIIYIVDTNRWIYKKINNEDDKQKNSQTNQEYNIKDYFHYKKITCDKLFCSDWKDIIPYSNIIETERNHYIWHDSENTKKIGYLKDGFIKHYEMNEYLKRLDVNEYLIWSHQNNLDIRTKKCTIELNENFYKLTKGDIECNIKSNKIVLMYSYIPENCKTNIRIDDFYNLEFKHFNECYDEYFDYENQSKYNPQIILPFNKKEKVKRQHICQLTKRK